MQHKLSFLYWMLVALGFAMQATASYNGQGPQVPSFHAYALLAGVAAVSALSYGLIGSPRVRSLMVACTLVSMIGRAVGWMSGWEIAYWARIVGIAPLIVTFGLTLQVNALLRQREAKAPK